MADYRFDAAEALVRPLITDSQAGPAAQVLLFQILAAKNDVAEGLPLGLELLERGDDPAVLAGLAQLYILSGQGEAAGILCAHLPSGPVRAGIEAKIAFSTQDFPRCLRLLDEALRHWPDDPRLTFLRGLTRLILGDLEGGWADYEARLRPGNPGRRHPFMDLPVWDGQSVPEPGRLLIWAEQGVGDEILFATMLPDAIQAAGPGRVDVGCDPRLIALFTRSYPGARYFPASAPPPGPKEGYRAQLALGSLPRLFRLAAGSFPASPHILIPAPERVAAFRQKLSTLGPAPFVGVAWRSLLPGGDRNGHYMTVEEMARAFNGFQGTLISLQYGLTAPERAFAAGAANPLKEVQGLDLKDDFDDTSALVAALSSVVSVDTTMAPLAAGTGTRTVWLTLTGRWAMLGGPGHPWFPASATLLKKPGDPWDPILREARSLVERWGG